MAYAITSQKRGKITRDIVATFTYAAAALDALAAKCPPEMMDYFTPGDAKLSLRDKILRAEKLEDFEVENNWLIGKPELLNQNSER